MALRRLIPLGWVAVVLALAACGGGDGGSSTHALGEEVVVEHSPAVTTGEQAPEPTMLGITVLAVRKGTQEELKQAGFTLDPVERTSTPYYVNLRLRNQSGPAIDRLASVSLEDDDGTTVRSTTVIDLGGRPFEACPQGSKGLLKPGQRYEQCELYLVPDGTEPSKASFLPYDPETPTDYVYWAVE